MLSVEPKFVAKETFYATQQVKGAKDKQQSNKKKEKSPSGVATNNERILRLVSIPQGMTI